MPSADQFNKYVENTKRRQEARAAQSANFTAINYFGLSDGESAQVRFLEQGNDLQYGVCHRVPITGGRFIDLICLNQTEENLPCPMCLSMNSQINAKRSVGFVNVIWRGDEAVQAPNFMRAPVYKKNEKGYYDKDAFNRKVVIGFEDGVFLWKCSKSVYEELLSKDSTYLGLMSRDFIVSRKGSSKENTRYFVEPAQVDGGAQPMSDADNKLMATKYNTVELTTPESYAEAAAKVEGSVPSYETEVTGSQIPVVRSNAFGK